MKAVDGVCFQVEEGEIFGLVGESGSGKTTIARLILGLETPTSGAILFEGVDITGLVDPKALKRYRMMMGSVFQDPYDSLNPMMNVYRILSEPLDVAGVEASKAGKLRRVVEALRSVRLTPPEDFLNKYPHELSGGQRQRVSLARSVMLNPKLLVADEPLSMLDVSLRADMLNLMEEMKNQHRLTILFITHDLAAARHLCDRIAVIYKGKIVETGPSDKIFQHPQHPYTKALKEAVPQIGRPLQPISPTFIEPSRDGS
ncbi:MAG: ABC transporter ATP-binding protein [Candidatus Bathyarchaeia archaeon]